MCKDDIFEFFRRCFETTHFPPELNSTLITLVPKCISPSSMTDLRPITLCNTLYKVITKILANRIKTHLSDYINPAQASFVPGRQITDNIFVVQEMFHKFRNTKGKKGFLAWKIDLSKAYDRVSWKFIMDCLKEMGIGGKAWDLIHRCISTVSYKVIMNGELSDSFKPECGIRQGDPLSPYLFVIAMEKLSQIIGLVVETKE